ncbi:hypothetical protein GF354_01785 [Candidatus Peregrinibacteria bacterium]|nr:hypothetical protein [Candidatus Peregrinibacteria bacterium]
MNKKLLIISVLSLFVFAACGQEEETISSREKGLIVNVDIVKERQLGKYTEYKPAKILREVPEKKQAPIAYMGNLNGSLNDSLPGYEETSDYDPDEAETFYEYDKLEDDYGVKGLKEDDNVDEDCPIGWRTYMGVTWCPDKGYIQSVKPNLSPNKGYVETLAVEGRGPIGYTSYIGGSAPKGYVESFDVKYDALHGQGYVEQMDVSDNALQGQGYIEQMDIDSDALDGQGYIEQMNVDEDDLMGQGYVEQMNVSASAFENQGYIQSICWVNEEDETIVCPDRVSGYIEYFGVSADVFDGQGYIERMDVRENAFARQGYMEQMGIVPDLESDLDWKEMECYELMTGLITCAQAPDSYIEYFGISSDYYDEVGYTGEMGVDSDSLFGQGYTDAMNIHSDSLANQGYVEQTSVGAGCYGYIQCLQPVDPGNRGYL